MNHFSFTDEAETDLNGIFEYSLQQWGQSQTSIYLDELELLCQKLANQPLLGTTYNHISADLFQFPFRSHILYYTIKEDGISIARILHMKMDIARMF